VITDPDLPDPTEAAPATEPEGGDDDVLSPGSTATGAGTTEADVSDGREQKLPRVD
jgi:hypothetical protein